MSLVYQGEEAARITDAEETISGVKFRSYATDVGKKDFRTVVGDDLPGGSTPSQYALPPGAQELQDLIEYREMNFAMGNIFKACYRKKDVGDPLYDIRKIIWFAKREESRLMKGATNG